MITTRDWWLGMFALVSVLLLHLALPRYDWLPEPGSVAVVRIDRWTGRAELGTFVDARGWISAADRRRELGVPPTGQ